jgi:glycosyltransferase involved in cell wall biosynthesis
MGESRVGAPAILSVATQGTGGDDEARLRVLLGELNAEFIPFRRDAKRSSFLGLLGAIRAKRPDLVVMEGTGIAGGLAVMLGRLLYGVPYVVSGGDAVAPFMTAKSRLLGPPFGLYERVLCRWSAGFIGWTPYLAGRALTFGSPRAMTAPGWAPAPLSKDERDRRRSEVRGRLGIAPEELVIGIVGSLAWTRRHAYCYGLELVRAMGRPGRGDVTALIVGDGDGRAHLEAILRERPGRMVILTGRVPRAEVPWYLAAMDLASLPQSCDGVGNFRYTTKISEYLAAGLPIVTGQIPLAYDLDTGWIWRLPGSAPWDDAYVSALNALLERLTPEDLAAKRAAVNENDPMFDRERQVARTTAFLGDLIQRRVPPRKGT